MTPLWYKILFLNILLKWKKNSLLESKESGLNTQTKKQWKSVSPKIFCKYTTKCLYTGFCKMLNDIWGKKEWEKRMALGI